MKKLFGLLIFAFAFVFSASASAGSVSVYANPHNDAKYANGAGMSVGLDVTKNVDVSLNYLDTNARRGDGGKKIFDGRIGMSAPIAGNLSGLAEVGYGSVHRADSDVWPFALGLKYTMAEKLFLVGKGTRYYKDVDEQRVQWTIGLGLNF